MTASAMPESVEILYSCGRFGTASRVTGDRSECTDIQWANRPLFVPYCTDHGAECPVNYVLTEVN
jgi:hypothetical protein